MKNQKSKAKAKSKAAAKKTADKKAPVKEVAPEIAEAVEEKPAKSKKREKQPRVKEPFGAKQILTIISVLFTLAVSAVSGYYFANASISAGQRYYYTTSAARAQAIADGVDLSISASPMYSTAIYMVALLAGAFLIIGLVCGRLSVLNYVVYAVATPVTMVLTFYLSIYGHVANMDAYFPIAHNFYRLFSLTALCGGIFLSIFTLMCIILRYRGLVKKGVMPDWDDLNEPEELPATAEVQPS